MHQADRDGILASLKNDWNGAVRTIKDLVAEYNIEARIKMRGNALWDFIVLFLIKALSYQAKSSTSEYL